MSNRGLSARHPPALWPQAWSPAGHGARQTGKLGVSAPKRFPDRAPGQLESEISLGTMAGPDVWQDTAAFLCRHWLS